MLLKGCLVGLLPFLTSSLQSFFSVQQRLVDIVQAVSCLQTAYLMSCYAVLCVVLIISAQGAQQSPGKARSQPCNSA